LRRMARAAVVVDKIIDYLSDNQEREIGDLTKVTGLEVEKMRVLLDFLEKFDFIRVNPKNGKVRLTDLIIGEMAYRETTSKLVNLP